MLAIEKDPSDWKGYYFHERQTQTIKRFIETNNHPHSIVVSGHTGCGKGTLVRLYIKATKCLNREPGTSTICGQCHNCSLDARTAGIPNDVIWVQRGQDETLTNQFRRALEEAYQPPNQLDEEHRYWKFIVFDELQSVPRDKLQDLLFYPELPQLVKQNRIVFVFITMDETRIDPGVFKPLVDRSHYLRLRPLTEDQLIQYLEVEFPELHPEVISMIATYAEGSLRGALAALDRCKQQDENLTPDSVAETLFFATASTRVHLWELMRDARPGVANGFKNLHEYWRAIEPYIEPVILLQQLSRDLDESMMVNATFDQMQAQDVLYSYTVSRARLRAWDVIKILAGKSLVNPELVARTASTMNGYQRIVTRA